MSEFEYRSDRVELEGEIQQTTTNGRFWLVIALFFLGLAGFAHLQANVSGQHATALALLFTGFAFAMSAMQRFLRQQTEKRLAALPER